MTGFGEQAYAAIAAQMALADKLHQLRVAGISSGTLDDLAEAFSTRPPEAGSLPTETGTRMPTHAITPCPFCGSAPATEALSATVHETGEKTWAARAYCPGCHVQFSAIDADPSKALSEVCTLWERRGARAPGPTPDPLADLFPELKDTLQTVPGSQRRPSGKQSAKPEQAPRPDGKVPRCAAPALATQEADATELIGALVIAERHRQVWSEGYTTSRDDQCHAGELAQAAAAYIWPSEKVPWPSGWDVGTYKPKGRRQDLIRGAALVLAEIERLDRLEAERAAR